MERTGRGLNERTVGHRFVIESDDYFELPT